MRLMEVRGPSGLRRGGAGPARGRRAARSAGRGRTQRRGRAPRAEAEPALFKLLRSAVYLAYYESPAIVRAIQGLGQPYKAVPIFEGYEQEPFDLERDRPRHNRGHWVRTEDVRPVDIAALELEEAKHGRA